MVVSVLFGLNWFCLYFDISGGAIIISSSVISGHRVSIMDVEYQTVGICNIEGD